MLHTSAAPRSMPKELRDAEITQVVTQLGRLLQDSVVSAPEIWAKYDQLKIRRIASFIPYEMWAHLLTACQRSPPEPEHSKTQPTRSTPTTCTERFAATKAKAGVRPLKLGSSHSGTPGAASLLSLLSSTDSHPTKILDQSLACYAGRFWTRTMAKRRALMILDDMWRCFCPGSAQGCIGHQPENRSEAPSMGDAAHIGNSFSAWRPITFHYNVVFDVICRDTSSSVDELIHLHRDMRLHSVPEDAVTFNTLLNGCRRLGAWGYFREVEEQISQRDEWGITRMDATTWGTLIQGYKQCLDWESVDRCVALATKACAAWDPTNSRERGATHGIRPTTELWSTIVNIYAARDMIPQMLASRRVMSKLKVALNVYTFGPVFAALHRLRKRLVRARKDAWPAILHTLHEFEAMRDANISPNASILTNVILTIGLNNPYSPADATYASIDDHVHAKVASIGGTVAKELERLFGRARDPNIYAALLNLAAKSGSYADIQTIWQTLLDELTQARGSPPCRLLTCLTLSSYINALTACKMYEEAITAFYTHVLPTQPDDTGQTRAQTQARAGMLTLPIPDQSVYEAALAAFARTDRHRMCMIIVRTMVSKGIQPSVLALRHTLLPPDHSVPGRRSSASYTRRWSLPLAIARSVWDMVADMRRSAWMRGPGPTSVYADAKAQREQPVIVNDVAAQLIRIAAYARNVEFGEDVFKALNSEATYFGIGHSIASSNNGRSNNLDGDSEADLEEETQSEETCGDTSTQRNPFPEDLQCAPNVRTYTSMITLYGNDANMAGVGEMWERMLRDKVEPNLHTYTSLIVALHKVALRKRWKDTQSYRERAEEVTSFKSREFGLHDASFVGSEEGSGGRMPWESTQQDHAINDIESWIVEPKSSVHSSNELAPGWLNNHGASPRLDIPLSTLLLRYHAMRIRDTNRGASGAQKRHRVAAEQSTSENIKRAMHVCHAIENAGLEPDCRFYAALADFLDTCGDAAGAELVRVRMQDRE